jgi:hypothetical protein
MPVCSGTTRSRRFSDDKCRKEFAKGKPIFVGIDVHKRDCLPAVRQGW